MRKILITAFACMLLIGSASAGTRCKVTMYPGSYDNPMKPGRPVGRGMAWIPQVYLENHLLSFETSASPIIIYIYRGDELIYTQMIAMGTTSVELPDSLKGAYTLYMFYGDIVYYGELKIF